MKNFIFISPNFPTNYWQFCRELKNDGMNVLGIGDQPYDELKPELKDSLNEYYKVNSLENYDEVYRAVAFLTFKHGRIDWLESNNEYWLERDAALRTDFHITSGFQTSDMPRIKYKSKMKECYQKAGIATARYHMVDDLAGCKKFVEEVGYPVVVKPDNGVGASDTHKLASDAELEAFLAYKAKEHPDVAYIMEEFVRAEVNSYDAIIDGSGNPIFEAGNVSPMSIMDIVNNDDNSIYYIIKDLPEDTRAAGRAAVKSFGVKSRFVHFEFFRMTEDQASMGKKGQIVALEVNMRPLRRLYPGYDQLCPLHQRVQDLGRYDRLWRHRYAGGRALLLCLCRPPRRQTLCVQPRADHAEVSGQHAHGGPHPRRTVRCHGQPDVCGELLHPRGYGAVLLGRAGCDRRHQRRRTGRAGTGAGSGGARRRPGCSCRKAHRRQARPQGTQVIPA